MPRLDRRHQDVLQEADEDDKDSITFIGSFERSVMAHSPSFHGNTSSKDVSRYSSRVLGTWGVVAIIFLYGCGGSMGSGSIIYGGGPLIGLIAIAVYPLVMTVPYGYIIAELCSAFPHDGGFALWVMHAFGPFWGLQVGYWSWLAGVLTCALVPDLLLKIILYCVDYKIESQLVTYLIKAAMALALALPSLSGTKFTSRVCMFFLVIVLLPLVVFTIWSFAETESSAVDFSQIRRDFTNATIDGSSDVTTLGEVNINWSFLINSLAWKFSGLNMASLFAGEVKDPSRVFPRAITIMIVLSFVAVLLPLLAAIAAHRMPWTEFDDPGMFIRVGGELGGTFLFAILIASSVSTAAGRFISCLYCTSFQISGMAENDLVPEFLANKNNAFRTPQYAVICTLLTILPLQLLGHDQMLSVCNAFAGAVELLILCAAVKLRLKMPYIPRPVKMPGGIVMLVLSALGPATVVVYIVYDSLISHNGAYMGLAALAAGVFYGLYDLWDRRRTADAFATAGSGAVITPAN